MHYTGESRNIKPAYLRLVWKKKLWCIPLETVFGQFLFFITDVGITCFLAYFQTKWQTFWGAETGSWWDSLLYAGLGTGKRVCVDVVINGQHGKASSLWCEKVTLNLNFDFHNLQKTRRNHKEYMFQKHTKKCLYNQPINHFFVPSLATLAHKYFP